MGHVGAPQQWVPLQPLPVEVESEGLGSLNDSLETGRIDGNGDVDVRGRSRATPDAHGDGSHDHVRDASGLEEVRETDEDVVELVR